MFHKLVMITFLTYYVNAEDNILEDRRLDFLGLAKKYGLLCEAHEVITEDDYILKIFHIPGDKTRPVLLVHGIIDTGDAFIIRGNSSLTVALVRKGYDVWIGNTRGNEYSRRHQRLNPDVDKEYWNFSFHEIGVWDLASKIDYVLNKTGQIQISFIGHSQATTAFFALASIRPVYNKKIKIFIALAPIAFLHHLDSSPMREGLLAWPYINYFFTKINKEEILGKKSLEKYVFKLLCSQKNAYEWCVKGLMMPINGYDLQEMEPEFWYVLLGHYPSATSLKSLSHYQQIWTKRKFCQMDYNEYRNLALYNSSEPPDYDLSKVTTKVALVAAPNDRMSRIEGVKYLKQFLPNVVDFIVLGHKTANHLDFTYGKHMHLYLFPHIMKLLEKYI
ncbi:unnamed protein product [Chilo suppressalis]|uniref:Lipase n=1 Tax=Chilo suppressalis TaxID=168631 RepID=A0ABN8L422_CHISP|nr:unnamed protein product [Chilo suppressalis]